MLPHIFLEDACEMLVSVPLLFRERHKNPSQLIICEVLPCELFRMHLKHFTADKLWKKLVKTVLSLKSRCETEPEWCSAELCNMPVSLCGQMMNLVKDEEHEFISERLGIRVSGIVSCDG